MARRILIVEDNRNARDSLCSLLRNMGNEVQTAGSAEDAVLLVHGFAPDVALLDVHLPGITGDVLALFLQHHYPKVRLVFLTSELRLEHPERFAPAIEFVHKPVDFGRLLNFIEGPPSPRAKLGAATPTAN